jgi:hypothetical protein
MKSFLPFEKYPFRGSVGRPGTALGRGAGRAPGNQRENSIGGVVVYSNHAFFMVRPAGRTCLIGIQVVMAPYEPTPPHEEQ